MLSRQTITLPTEAFTFLHVTYTLAFGYQRVNGQNGSGQNGTDKMVWTKIMVWTKWYTDKLSLDKMVWTKWYGQSGRDKMVATFGIDYNSGEINTNLVTKSHK